MADKTKIEWTDATWNPITGCSVISPGCTNCYAMKLAGTRMRNHWSREGLTQPSNTGPVWNGEVRFNEKWLDQPLHWRKPRKIFVCAHGDLFHESVPDEWIDQIFAAMALCPQHTFQVLTKRAKRMRKYMDGYAAWVRVERLVVGMQPRDLWNGPAYEAMLYLQSGRPLPNVHLGVSVEDQRRADARIPLLLGTPAAVRFISAEPLLGPLTVENTFCLIAQDIILAVVFVSALAMTGLIPSTKLSLGANPDPARGLCTQTGRNRSGISAWLLGCHFFSSNGGIGCHFLKSALPIKKRPFL